jgi:hypothetical protein
MHAKAVRKGRGGTVTLKAKRVEQRVRNSTRGADSGSSFNSVWTGSRWCENRCLRPSLMKRLLTMTFAIAICASALARLGDTQDQAEARYGLPKKPLSPVIVPFLIEGAKELSFGYEGWKIRCALLPATDGKEYVEYRKIWNSEVMKKGGTIQIRDYERDAVLKGEAGSGPWQEKLLGDLDRNPIQALTNQFTHLTGISGKVWIREDGAIARMRSDSLVLDLPQARKYEAELKAIKDQKARAAVPRF